MKTTFFIKKNQYQTKTKKRVNFDTLLKEQEVAISKMSLKELDSYREDLKNQLSSIHNSLKEKSITDGRIKYLWGRRKFATILLSSTKKRMKAINVSVHNGSSIALTKRFFNIAAKELPIDKFQTILGLALIDLEEEENKNSIIRQFMQEAKDKINKGEYCGK